MKCLNPKCNNDEAYPLSLSLNLTLGDTAPVGSSQSSEVLFGPNTKAIGTSCEACGKKIFGEDLLEIALGLVGVSQEKNKPLAVDFDTKKFSYAHFQ
jgi:hypothetical protein